MRVYLKPRSAQPSASLTADCEMLSALICRTLKSDEQLSPGEAMRHVQAQTERVFRFDWDQVWLVVEESCEQPQENETDDASRPARARSNVNSAHSSPGAAD